MTSRASSGVDALLAAGAAAGPVLGLCTATPSLSLGIVQEGRVAAHLSRTLDSHGALLPAAVEELLGTAGLESRDLKGIAVGLGPGSFTGLRIGLSYAKGLGMASGAAIAGVPSLDAAATAVLASGQGQCGQRICALWDARRGEVYAALYQIVADGLQKLTADMVLSLKDLAQGIEGEIFFIGDAKAAEAQSLSRASGRLIHVTAAASATGLAPAGGAPDAASLAGAMVAALGARRIALGEADRAAALEPIYLRAADATAKLNITSLSIDGREGNGVWSAGKRNSSSGMRPTTRN